KTYWARVRTASRPDDGGGGMKSAMVLLRRAGRLDFRTDAGADAVLTLPAGVDAPVAGFEAHLAPPHACACQQHQNEEEGDRADEPRCASHGPREQPVVVLTVGRVGHFALAVSVTE